MPFFFSLLSLIIASSAMAHVSTTLTPRQAQAAYEEVAHSSIPFRIVDGGCETRSFFISQILKSKEIQSFQIRYNFGPSGTHLYLEQSLAPDKIVSWYNHVVAAVRVRVNQKNETWVIDPALAPRALPEKIYLKTVFSREKSVPYFKRTLLSQNEFRTHKTLFKPDDELLKAQVSLIEMKRLQNKLENGEAPFEVLCELYFGPPQI